MGVLLVSSTEQVLVFVVVVVAAGFGDCGNDPFNSSSTSTSSSVS